MAYTKYSLTPANNTAAPPDGAPEGMLPSAVNDTMRDMMAQIRDVGDGIRDGTYTMTAPKITGGTITGAAFTGNTFTSPVISGGTINNATIGATTASTGKFTAVTNSALTSGRVTYAGTAGVLQDDADFTFNGTTVTMANDASISGLTVGKGGGAVATNTVVGSNALNSNTSGSNNTANGFQSLTTNTTGSSNTGHGQHALALNTTGSFNTAVGNAALFSSTTAAQNTAVGREAGYANTTGQYLAFLGHAAGRNNTTGSSNVAIGETALFSNTTASNNTAVGYQALYANTTGARNTAVGFVAGVAQTTPTQNAFFGGYAGYAITTGGYNTFIGDGAGVNATTGIRNTFIGVDSGISGGAGGAITTGSRNTIIGGYTGNNDGLDIRTASNYAVISDGDGNRLLSTYNGGTLALDGGAVPQAGTGITFPATQSASSDANTLDDYEEGTWTPSFSAATTPPTGVTYDATYRLGRYVKIGRMVFVEYIMILTNKGTGGVGDCLITGLPFAHSSNNIFSTFTGTVCNLTTGRSGVYMQINTGASQLVALYGNGGTAVGLPWSDAANNTDFRGMLCYETT